MLLSMNNPPAPIPPVKTVELLTFRCRVPDLQRERGSRMSARMGESRVVVTGQNLLDHLSPWKNAEQFSCRTK